MSGNHCCDHSCEGHQSINNTEDLGVLYSLYTRIDTERIECLNEAIEGSGKTVFKPWDQRLNFEQVCHPFRQIVILICVQLFDSLLKAIATKNSSLRFRLFYNTLI